MTSRASGSEAFERLHPKVQRWIWEQKWSELREVQERAVEPILAARQDVILAAATAGGKTEAAFLPIVSRLAGDALGSVRALYVSPLKALINDQFRRLDELCESLDIPVHRWHGDVDGGRKKALLRDPSGILLITPESLEALFVLNGAQVPRLFTRLEHIVLDELHAFLGSGRGRQLQSLLHRIESAVARRIPRIGLSATLGDMSAAAGFLRPRDAGQVVVVVSAAEGQELRAQVRGYLVAAPPTSGDEDEVESPGAAQLAIRDHLFRTLRGSDNLIFANRRRDVELYTDLLRRKSDAERVPNEFWPHHGSLSRELREEVETRLRERTLPINVLCTSTLELGIDIGNVKSVAQLGPPLSVAGLRQRLGRSGRRGDASILRVYVTEPQIRADSAPTERLRLDLVQSVAMIGLLVERWYEPPGIGELHLSTLVQQVLSVIAQHGGSSAARLWTLLGEAGPFEGVGRPSFLALLRDLGRTGLLEQAPDGTLLLGEKGERQVEHYSFYAAFSTPEEYRLVALGRTLGTLPISSPLAIDMYLIFAGRRWRIVGLDPAARVVELVPGGGGRAPVFSGSGARIHDRVRAAMRQALAGEELPAFLDPGGLELLREGREEYRRLGLAGRSIVEHSSGSVLFPWRGDRVLDTIAMLLRSRELSALRVNAALSIPDTSPADLARHLEELAASEPPSALALALSVANKREEKWHWCLSDELLAADLAASRLDVPGAWEALRAAAGPA